MDMRFQQHLMQVQTNELLKYIETLEKDNADMLYFIDGAGLSEMFNNNKKRKEEVAKPNQVPTGSRGIMEVHD